MHTQVGLEHRGKVRMTKDKLKAMGRIELSKALQTMMWNVCSHWRTFRQHSSCPWLACLIPFSPVHANWVRMGQGVKRGEQLGVTENSGCQWQSWTRTAIFVLELTWLDFLVHWACRLEKRSACVQVCRWWCCLPRRNIGLGLQPLAHQVSVS